MRLTSVCDPFPHCVLPAPPTDSSKIHAQVSWFHPFMFSFFFFLLLVDHFFSIKKFSDAEFSSLTSKTPAFFFFFVKRQVSQTSVPYPFARYQSALRSAVLNGYSCLSLRKKKKKKKFPKSHRIYPVSHVKSLMGLLRCTPDDGIWFGTVIV